MHKISYQIYHGRSLSLCAFNAPYPFLSLRLSPVPLIVSFSVSLSPTDHSRRFAPISLRTSPTLSDFVALTSLTSSHLARRP
jgi:hypothetical protein